MAVGEHDRRGSAGFYRLALTTAALTWGLIVFGAVVRVTESGLGCGNDWPLCNGSIFPPLDNITAWIELLHRLFALLIGILGLVLLLWSWRQQRRALTMVALAALLYLLQSALGAIVVFLDLPPTFVTLHLGCAMLLFGALLAATVAAHYQPSQPYRSDGVTQIALINGAFALLIILTGALTRGSGATLACTEWPQCSPGNWLPLDHGHLALVNLVHRLSVLAMTLSLLLLIWQARRHRSELLVERLAWVAGLFYLLQIGVGAMFVITRAGAAWGAAHVGLAAAVWGALVILLAVERINQREFARRRA